MIKEPSLAQQWEVAKSTEAEWTQRRRKIEDDLVKWLQVPETLDGTKNVEIGDYKVKIEGRINKKINSDLLQELAVEAGLEDHLSSLFRWKPEINATAWKAADPALTNHLLGAITSTPGRPSFSVTLIKKD